MFRVFAHVKIALRVTMFSTLLLTTTSAFVNCQTFGVFDGVSAWFQEDGIDAGEFAWIISRHTEDEIKRTDVSLPNAVTNALHCTHVEGSATACVVRMDTATGLLNTYMLGDSGFVVLRPTTTTTTFVAQTSSRISRLLGLISLPTESTTLVVVAFSKPMMHSEDTPFQLGSYATADKPITGLVSTIQTQPDDLVILGSDGLFDNMTIEEIVVCAEAIPMENAASPKKLAWLLGCRAEKKWNVIDDITVLVGHVI